MSGIAEEIIAAGFDPPGDFSSNNCVGWPEPSVFVQWKGTDVCMDFHCECGAHCHFDGYFAYTVKCLHCETVWEMPQTIYPRKVNSKTNEYWVENPQHLEPDEDFMDDEGNAIPLT